MCQGLLHFRNALSLLDQKGTWIFWHTNRIARKRMESRRSRTPVCICCKLDYIASGVNNFDNTPQSIYGQTIKLPLYPKNHHLM